MCPSVPYWTFHASKSRDDGTYAANRIRVDQGGKACDSETTRVMKVTRAAFVMALDISPSGPVLFRAAHALRINTSPPSDSAKSLPCSMGSTLLLNLGAAVAAFGLYKGLKFIYAELTSPLRYLPGPENPSWIYGNFKEIWKE
ncbi:hypothetical protein H0H92_007772, partial [Tricholoma furcatifolium]